MMLRTILVAAIFTASASSALAMRCGVSLVVEGQSKFDVLQRCGEPAYRDSRVEYRPVQPNLQIPRPLNSPDAYFPYNSNYPYPATREVVIEEWVYNFGSTQLMPSLLFENGRLITIRTLGYGR